jgi:hypothetical protein
MASISALQGSSSAVTASLLRSAEQNPEVTISLLKKVNDADKNLVNTLLPASGVQNGRLDIQA